MIGTNSLQVFVLTRPTPHLHECLELQFNGKKNLFKTMQMIYES